MACLALGLALVTTACGGGGGQPTGIVAKTSSASASSAASGSAPATGSAAASTAGAGEIKLGAVLPLTGKFSASGKYFEEGYTMAVDEVNKAGGVDVGGKKMKVTLVLLDDGSDGTRSRSLVEKLVTQEKVNALLGGYDTVLVQAQEGVPDQYKIPMVEGGGAASAIFSRGYKYVFGTLATIDRLGDITMDFLKDQIDQGHLPKNSKIALVWENTDHGKDYDEAVRRRAQADKRYYEVVLNQSFQLNGSDFSPLLTQVKAANADIFLSDAHLPDFITMHRQYTQLGLKHKMVSYAARGADQKGREALKQAADYLVSALWWSPELDAPASKKFAADYKARYGKTADWFQALAYDTARVMFAGISKAGTLDGTTVRDTLASLEFKNSILPGGAIKFAENGSPLTPYMMVQNLPGGDFPVQVVWPKSMPEFKPAILPIPEK